MKKILKWIRQHILCSHRYDIKRKWVKRKNGKDTYLQTSYCYKCGRIFSIIDWRDVIGEEFFIPFDEKKEL